MIFQVICSKKKLSKDLFYDENELLLSLLTSQFPFTFDGYLPYGHEHECVKGSSFHPLQFNHHHHHHRPHCNRFRPFGHSHLKYPPDDHYYGHHHHHNLGNIFMNPFYRRRIFRLCHRHLRRLLRRIRHQTLLHHSIRSIVHDHIHLKRG